MSVRLRITCIAAICASTSITVLVFCAGIAAACEGGGGGGGCTTPTASTGSATAITSNSATLNGSVNAQGCITNYIFEWGTSSAGPYPNSAEGPAGSETFPKAVSTKLQAGMLQPSTQYYFRLSAINTEGKKATGSAVPFKTAAACLKPTVTTDIATSITDVTAVLGGIVDPRGCAATYWFEWGPSSQPTTYPNKTPAKSAGTSSAYQLEEIKGLQPSTGYHFRLSANNSAGTTPGIDKPFTTKPLIPKDPILFVHGWESSSDTWDYMKSWFKDSGWPSSRLFTIDYDTNQPNEDTAELIPAQVNFMLALTGAQKVDIITHSMGGYSSRYYLKFLGGTSKVEDWVSLAGPNHGTDTIAFCAFPGCEDMKLNSTFLQKLNAGDETPGTVRYATWRSSCDGVVIPTSSVELIGAVQNILAPCLFHTEIHRDYPTFEKVRDFVK